MGFLREADGSEIPDINRKRFPPQNSWYLFWSYNQCNIFLEIIVQKHFFVKFQLSGHSFIQRSRWQWNSWRIPNKFRKPIAYGLDNQSNAFIDCYWQNGELDLTFYIYRLSFLNFLLGKQANGPGQYLFGTVTPETPTCMFPIGKIHGPLQKWTDYSKLTMTKLGSRISWFLNLWSPLFCDYFQPQIS